MFLTGAISLNVPMLFVVSCHNYKVMLMLMVSWLPCLLLFYRSWSRVITRHVTGIRWTGALDEVYRFPCEKVYRMCNMAHLNEHDG